MDPVEINLNEYILNERRGIYSTLGRKIKRVLAAMFRGVHVPTTVKGSKQDVQAFIDTLLKEKKYMVAYLNYGLDDPRTYGSRARLDAAVRSFERTSGITWPFK